MYPLFCETDMRPTFKALREYHAQDANCTFFAWYKDKECNCNSAVKDTIQFTNSMEIHLVKALSLLLPFLLLWTGKWPSSKNTCERSLIEYLGCLGDYNPACFEEGECRGSLNIDEWQVKAIFLPLFGAFLHTQSGNSAIGLRRPGLLGWVQRTPRVRILVPLGPGGILPGFRQLRRVWWLRRLLLWE